MKNLLTLISNFEITFSDLKNEILNKYSKELFGYPPGKDKKGKRPKIDKIQKIIFLKL